MASVPGASNKAKIARRVVEVLEFFDDDHREATVMDIVRRYDRPQSSTSELLSSLVELGLLYKDPYSRSYTLTPRSALLGVAGQADPLRDGRLIRLIDRLVAQTGLAVALFGRVGLNSQIVNWRSATRDNSIAVKGLYGGMQQPLCDSAVGWLILGTEIQPRRDGIMRRLIAESPEARRPLFTELSARVDRCRATGLVQGGTGYGLSAHMVGMLLPGQPTEHPLAIGLLYGADSRVDSESLLVCLAEAITHCLVENIAPRGIDQLPNAA